MVVVNCLSETLIAVSLKDKVFRTSVHQALGHKDQAQGRVGKDCTITKSNHNVLVQKKACKDD